MVTGTAAASTGGKRSIDLGLAAVVLGGLAIAAGMIWFSWVGWIGSDDARHIDGALGWYDDFPYVAREHGEFRHFIALPAALSFTLFGLSSYSAVLPILLYYFGLLAVTLYEMQRRAGSAVALLAVALIASLSIFSVQATVVYSDIAEAFFVILSLWCFLRACEGPGHRISLLMLAGFLAGAAWLTRETTAALLLFYGLLFLVGFGMPRRLYWIMAIGFFIPVLADAAYFWIQTGSPFYRYQVIFNARASFSSMHATTGELFNDIGNIQANPLIDPLLAVLVNHEIGFIFYLAPFAFWGLWKDRTIPPSPRQLGLLLLALALVWFVVTSLAVTRYHPRYFTVAAYAVALASAIWLVQGLFQRRPKVAGIVVAAVISVGVAGIYLENRNPVFGARTLVQVAINSTSVVHSDPETFRRGQFLLRAAGVETHASLEPPIAGDLFLFNPNRVSASPNLCRFRPADDWEELEVFRDSPKLIARLITGLGLVGHLHPSIERRLLRPNAPVRLYRVGEAISCRS